MSDFIWDEEESTEFSMDNSVIPDGTQVLAFIESIEWKDGREPLDPQVISATWSIMEPSEYEGRKVFQNIKILDEDEKRATRQRKMFGAIDANCGGHLRKKGGKPTDPDMARALINKPMTIQLRVWQMNGSEGNWISKVGPKASYAPPIKNDDDFSDDIAF